MSSNEALVRLRNVSKSFGDVVAVSDVTFDAPAGKILALLGPSGCGKTTSLRLIAGFERADAGTIAINDRIVEGRGKHVPPERRRVGVVFQDYALFPHLTVAGNVAFGLGRRGRHDPRGAEMLELVGLEELADRYPRELSGGQQQRVALARALAPGPDLILLDEPFSNLDQSLRQRVRADVERILRDASVTAVFVTHAQDEALSMADAVCVMRDGQIVQCASPEQLYWKPATPFVAEFIADASIVPGTTTGAGLETPFGTLAYAGPVREGEQVLVALRPESISLDVDGTSPFVICDREYYGHDELVTISEGNGTTVRCRLDAGHVLQPGTRVRMAIKVGAGDVFPKV